ncbi:MAG: glucose-6-phosphate isomerase, partial [Candidatus Margulisiibacteriota bacterium]
MSFNRFSSYEKLTRLSRSTLQDLFAQDPARGKNFTLKTEHIYFDYSRQQLSQETLSLLIELAKESGLKAKIDAMSAGEKINVTENRSVLHMALRAGTNPDVQAVLEKIKTFSNAVHFGKHLGVTGKKLKNIVAIGIGGSYLGPEYLAEACRVYAKEGMTLRFIANVDGTDFAQKTADLNAEETLFIIVSKTFTTAETMKNAETAKAWMKEKLGNSPDVIKKHFIAVSTAKEKVEAFGIDSENMFGFWDWVGGRYSATSAVGAVPLSLFLGFDKFQEILEGAHWMDEHFRTTPFEKNIPVIAALIDIWNINFLGLKVRAILPYCQALSRYPAHAQQVEMESNGKLVDINGNPVDFATGEVIFGEPGTNGQHSFYQLLHQGTLVVPADFIGFIEPQYAVGSASATEVTHHQELMTNFLAQPDALAFGQKDVNPAKNFPGNRPSSSLLLQKLTPFTAGILLAFLEHRTATKGFIWGINSFDQFGVELGKKLGVDQRKRMLTFNANEKVDTVGLNSS